MNDWWSEAPEGPPPAAPRAYWPQMTEYIDAIEHRQVNPDTALSTLRPVEGGFFGGPIALAGRTAVVFRMEGPRGGHYALRVFLSEPSPNMQRVCELSSTPGLPMPAMTWFEEGVLSGDEWWPVMVMPWCEGSPLDIWLDRHRSDPPAIRDVATTILEQVVSLSQMGIVHGDLQHGNVLVGDDGSVTFVDLDGTVRHDPSNGHLLSGWQAPGEAGHPNYQHPERTRTSVWTPSVDIYSALVIDTSMRAVALEPKLMDKYYVEDNLLLVASDLDSPAMSEVFDRLRELGDEAIDVRSRQLVEFGRQTIQGLRPADPILFGGDLPAGPPYARPWYDALPTHVVSSDWEATGAMVEPGLDADLDPIGAPPTTAAVPAPPTFRPSTTSGTNGTASIPTPASSGFTWTKALLLSILIALVVFVVILAVRGGV